MDMTPTALHLCARPRKLTLNPAKTRINPTATGIRGAAATPRMTDWTPWSSFNPHIAVRLVLSNKEDWSASRAPAS